MATFQIAVRTEDSPGGTHEHISHVGIETAQHVLSRSTVIKDLRDPDGGSLLHLRGRRPSGASTEIDYLPGVP